MFTWKAPEQGTIGLIIVTAAITGLVIGVFGKRLAEFLLDMFLRPIKFFYEVIYQWIAPRNPFSISIRSYRKHILRSDLTRIENPIGPKLEVPLEYAFAPIKVRSNSTNENVDLISYITSTDRCILLGGPGTGKTTLMKSVVLNILSGQCNPDIRSLIPVFVVLRNLAKQQQTVDQAIVSAFADYHFPKSDDFVRSALAEGKLIIILDGLDEVGANREFVSGAILDFCNTRYLSRIQLQNKRSS